MEKARLTQLQILEELETTMNTIALPQEDDEMPIGEVIPLGDQLAIALQLAEGRFATRVGTIIISSEVTDADNTT